LVGNSTESNLMYCFLVALQVRIVMLFQECFKPIYSWGYSTNLGYFIELGFARSGGV